MRRLATILLVGLVAGCANTPSPAPASPSPSPASASPSPSPSAVAVTITVDCGGVSRVSDCLAMVAAAADAVPLSGDYGLRAEVSSDLASPLTPSGSVVHRVTFMIPSGSSDSLWVVNGRKGYVATAAPPVVVPSPPPGANGPSPTPETIAIDCDGLLVLSDCVAMVSGAAERIPPGVRAEVTKGATPDYAAVMFISSTGSRQSIWVVSNPIGGWTGAYSINGVTPPP